MQQDPSLKTSLLEAEQNRVYSVVHVFSLRPRSLSGREELGGSARSSTAELTQLTANLGALPAPPFLGPLAPLAGKTRNCASAGEKPGLVPEGCEGWCLGGLWRTVWELQPELWFLCLVCDCVSVYMYTAGDESRNLHPAPALIRALVTLSPILSYSSFFLAVWQPPLSLITLSTRGGDLRQILEIF